MDPNNPPRWAADPTGRHQYRYWDGQAWTDQVSDNGAVSTDPPVASPQVPQVQPTPAPDTPPPFPGGLVVPPAAATPPPASEPASVPASEPAAPAGWAPPGETAPGYAAPYAAAAVPQFQPSPAAPPGFWMPNQDSTSVLGRRYGAFFIDLVICLIVWGVLFTAFATQRTAAETARLPGCHYSDSFSGDTRMVDCDNRAVFQVNNTVYEADLGPTVGLFLVFTLFMFMLPEALAGASLGKLMTGVRVVRPDGGKIGIGRSMLRWLLFWVDGPITLFLCGIITSSVSRGHRRLGDMAADSYVVGKDNVGHQVMLPAPR